MSGIELEPNEVADQDHNGFTIVELVIAVLIVGILAVVSIPIFTGVQERAFDNALRAAVKNEATAAVSNMTTRADGSPNLRSSHPEFPDIYFAAVYTKGNPTSVCVTVTGDGVTSPRPKYGPACNLFPSDF